MPSLNTVTGAKHARIYSVGTYRPRRVVTNAEVCEFIDSSDEWIRERSGIVERRWAGEGESVVFMASEAAKIAINRAGIEPTDIGLIMLGTVSHPYPFPSAAVEVGEIIGARGAPAFDFAAACAGFCYGVGMAADIIRGGSAKYILVIGVERLTDVVNKHDRGTSFIFADGAGAAVIGPSDIPGIGPIVWGGDGSQKDAITVTASINDFRDGLVPDYPTAVMAGQQVFRWAVGEMPKATKEALEQAGITAADLDVFIPHQA
nr:beta-ketoacyl-ACP synthase 3 [Actinomycetes bacterium]